MSTIRPPLGRLYDTSDGRMFAHRAGEGGPAVVFAGGANAVGLDYLNLLDEVAEFTTAVAYDRLGTGWSERVPLPRMARQHAADLRAVLQAADIPGPYLFVPHSLSGVAMRRYAQLWPDEVVGMVGLEPFYERWDDFMPPKMHLATAKQPKEGGATEWIALKLMRRFYRKLLADWPADVRAVLVEAHATSDWYRCGVGERSNLAELATEMKAGGPFPDIPMVCFVAMAVDPGQRMLMSRKSMNAMMDGKRRAYRAMVEQVLHGRYEEMPDGNHSAMYITGSGRVVKAIAAMVEAHRGGNGGMGGGAAR